MNKRILKLAVPNILSNLTVPLLGMVDLALSGHLENAYAIGAIAVATTTFSLIYWSFSFLRMGTTGLTAQSNGKGDKEGMGRNLAQSAFIGLVASIIILFLQQPLLRLALMVLVPDASLTGYVATYFNIVVWGAPAILLTYALNGWLIGMQNTWVPMLVSIITNITNVAISSWLVLVEGMGVSGIAIGTLVAQWLGVLLLSLGAYLLFIGKGKVVLPRHIKDLKVELGRYFSTNIHIFLRTMLLGMVSFFFTYSGSHQGSLTLSTNALLYQFFTFFNYFADGFAFAGEALVGHFFGKKERALLQKTIRLLYVWGISLALLTSVLYMIGANAFLELLTDKAEVIDYAQIYLPWVYLLPLTGIIAILYDGIFVGVTATREMFLSMLVAVVVFFILYFIAPFEDENHNLWFAFDIYLLIRGVMQVAIAKRLRGLGRPFLYTYFLSIGSTILEKKEMIIDALDAAFPQGLMSQFSTSHDATGKTDKVYINSVMQVTSEWTLEEMKERVSKIETQCGRDRESNEVALDIDIVVQDDEVLRHKDFARDYFQEGYRELCHLA